MWVHMYTERSDRAHADADSYARTQTEQSGNKPQERSSLGIVSLTDRALCMRTSNINMGLDYDSIQSC